MTKGELLEVTDLAISAPGGALVSGINLRLNRGETLGIVGESGSGKSLTASAIMGLLPEQLTSSGEIRFNGVDLLKGGFRKVRGAGIAMMLQDPFTALHPRMTCGNSVMEAVGKGLSRKEVRAEAVRRLAEVGITDPSVIDRYPFQLSGGMLQRIALAATLARDPELLIADEPTTALDVTTQAEILELLGTIQRARDMAVIFITHDLRVAFDMCDDVQVFYAGTNVEVGPARTVKAQPKHPYSLGLIHSQPPLKGEKMILEGIPGTVPPAKTVMGQCPFASRCQWVQPQCLTTRPELIDVGSNHFTRCIRIDEIASSMSAKDDSRVVLGEIYSGQAPTILEIQQVDKTYDRRHQAPVPVLKDVSLVVHEGESVGLVGGSGSGKTTLGKCIVGLEQADLGSIKIDGLELADRSRLSKPQRKLAHHLVQMIFQDPKSSLDPTQRIGDGLEQLLALADPAYGTKKSPSQLLDEVGLTDAHLGRFPHQLSGGQRQRVAIARALSLNPRVLVCDEPVSSLDVSIQAQILNLFNELRRSTNLSMLFISHDLSVVRQVVDRVYVMHEGRIVETGEVDQVLTDPQDPYTQKLVASIIQDEAAV